MDHPEHEQPLRQACRAAERQDDRGRVLRAGEPLPEARPRMAPEVIRRSHRRSRPSRAAPGPAHLPGLRLGAGLPDPVGGGRPRELERPAPLPELRALPRGRLRPGHGRALRRGARPRHRRPGARLQAPDAREHGRGDRPLRRRARRRTRSCPKTSSPPRRSLRRSARRRRRRPARARAGARRRARASPASAFAVGDVASACLARLAQRAGRRDAVADGGRLAGSVHRRAAGRARAAPGRARGRGSAAA